MVGISRPEFDLAAGKGYSAGARSWPAAMSLETRARPIPRSQVVLATTLLGALALALPAASAARPVLVYNASASAPLGFYIRARGAPRRGDFVLARLPADAARLAAERGYLPASVPIVKRVAALTGDLVCVASDVVSVNGKAIATALHTDHQGRPLLAWDGCRTLAEGEIFLLMQAMPASFDGRYFGPVTSAAIVGKLLPLWTW